MPTWRSWLDSVSNEDFAESDYFKNYEAMLADEQLNQLLEDDDLYITFYLHPILRKYIHDFHVKSKRIRLVEVGEEPLNEIMMRCRLMITDYSSASWDMFYMKKPVIFYQFDEEEYNKVHGSYMDFEKDLFGERVRTLEALVDCLRDAKKRDFTLKQEYLAKWEKAFAYVDTNNSKRILEQIKKRNWDSMDS